MDVLHQMRNEAPRCRRARLSSLSVGKPADDAFDERLSALQLRLPRGCRAAAIPPGERISKSISVRGNEQRGKSAAGSPRQLESTAREYGIRLRALEQQRQQQCGTSAEGSAPKPTGPRGCSGQRKPRVEWSLRLSDSRDFGSVDHGNQRDVPVYNCRFGLLCAKFVSFGNTRDDAHYCCLRCRRGNLRCREKE